MQQFRFSSEQRRIRKWIRELLATGIPACAGALETFGEAAIPATLEALTDARARPSASNPDPKPLAGLCRVLHPFAPPHAVPILANYLPMLRGNALHGATTLLLAIATGEAIAVLTAALAADEVEQRGTMELALFVEAARGLRLGPDEAAALADVLVPRLSAREGRMFQNLLRTLLVLDEPRMMSFLIEQDYLAAEHSRFHEVLDALERARAAPPVELLEFLVPIVRDREQHAEIGSGRAESIRYAPAVVCAGVTGSGSTACPNCDEIRKSQLGRRCCASDGHFRGR